LNTNSHRANMMLIIVGRLPKTCHVQGGENGNQRL
jgi:hypothetical protein